MKQRFNQNMDTNPILIPLDVPTSEKAIELAKVLSPHVGGFKVGLELFTHGGKEVVQDIKQFGKELFLDLKFHDIPNTVAKAVANATRLNVDWLTIHCSGGPEMVKAAENAAQETAATLGIKAPVVLGVTVLTSMNQDQLTATGVKDALEDQVARLAEMAVSNGLRGLVCSPLELPRLRSILPDSIHLVTPGIRAKSDAMGDQKRTLGPKEAMDAGASRLVIGRPITAAPNAALAAQNIYESLLSNGE
jgi:orotidine-5'-phosphate decarboxylase